MEIYVSENGSDNWTGRLAEKNETGTDGPLATIHRARELIREKKDSAMTSESITVWLREGTYPITGPIKFHDEDSYPVTYKAYPGEWPVIDGSKKITGWKTERVDGKEVWVAAIPQVAAGKWYFRQLFVNGERRERTRLPKSGYYWIKDVPGVGLDGDFFAGSDSFRCYEGDFKVWRNLADVEVVALHFWVDERMPVAAFEEDCLIRSSRRSIFILKDDVANRYARYYIENVFEALEKPGEWYLDRQKGQLYYMPMSGEQPDKVEICAPVVTQFMKLSGKPADSRYVENIKFEGICFRYSDWYQPAGGGERCGMPGVDFASAPQASYNIPGAIEMEGARHCAFINCKIEHAGWYGIVLGNGCMHNRIEGNEICDAGAGGIKLDGADSEGSVLLHTGRNRVTDNHIHHCGKVFHSAAGILSMHSYGNFFTHNHIHDLYYSGISCGLLWDYGRNNSYDNHIEKNHIHDLGYGLLSDMGGIYTLGVQPGTVIRGNMVHDIKRHSYGGWGIYLDGASSHVLVENNICYHCSSQGFMQNYGRENIVRNNIFAMNEEGQAALCRGEKHNSFTFERNIAVCRKSPVFVGHGSLVKLCNRSFISDLNLFWDVSRGTPQSEDGDYSQEGNWEVHRVYSPEDWKDIGYDIHSSFADPLFIDPQKGNFILHENSPAFRLGFRAIDMSDIGPRPENRREEG